MQCVAAAAVPTRGSSAPPLLGARGGAVGRLRRRGDAVALCDASEGSPRPELESWCTET